MAVERNIYQDLEFYDQVLGSLSAGELVAVLKESANCSAFHYVHTYHEWPTGFDSQMRPKVGRGPCGHIVTKMAKAGYVARYVDGRKSEGGQCR